MKKRFSLIRSVMGVLLITFLFSACKKDNSTLPETPVSGLMAFNLVPNETAIGITLSGSELGTTPLYYTNYTGNYLPIYTGNRSVKSYDFSTGSTLAETTQLFEDSSYYSVFVVGENNSYKNVVVKDNLDSLSYSAGFAFVRYVNAIADSTMQPSVTISSEGTDIFNDNAKFGSVSDFKPVAAGDISINVNSNTDVNASRTISVDDGKIYTILLSGIPGETDSTKAVQIKFIQNGSITP